MVHIDKFTKLVEQCAANGDENRKNDEETLSLSLVPAYELIKNIYCIWSLCLALWEGWEYLVVPWLSSSWPLAEATHPVLLLALVYKDRLGCKIHRTGRELKRYGEGMIRMTSTRPIHGGLRVHHRRLGGALKNWEKSKPHPLVNWHLTDRRSDVAIGNWMAGMVSGNDRHDLFSCTAIVNDGRVGLIIREIIGRMMMCCSVPY